MDIGQLKKAIAGMPDDQEMHMESIATVLDGLPTRRQVLDEIALLNERKKYLRQLDRLLCKIQQDEMRREAQAKPFSQKTLP